MIGAWCGVGGALRPFGCFLCALALACSPCSSRVGSYFWVVIREIEVLGSGGMGTSHRARYLGDGQPQALLLWAWICYLGG